MSDGIIIAFISLVGAILGALITGFTTIIAAGVKGKSEGKNENQGSSSCAIVGLVATLGGIGGLVLGGFFGVFLFQKAVGTLPTQSPLQTQAPLSTTPPQCSHFQVASSTQTMVTVPAGMWEVTRKCSPSQSACFYTMEQSSGGQYLSYEHNGSSDRYWVNAFCTEAEAKSFANIDARAMLEWWQNTQQNPFP